MAKYNSMRPLRQGDPRWGNQIMWDRAKVIDAHVRLNGATRRAANKLLREFQDGNSIGNEGCLLTCLAMVLRSLHRRSWTPKTLNTYAKEQLFYSHSGLSMTPLYADLVSDASQGEVQLCLKEEYLSGERGWQPVYTLESRPVKAYLALPRRARQDFMVMLKTGTHDDSFASHYVILDPETSATPKTSNLSILDPIMPFKVNSSITWTLRDSAKVMCTDKVIRKEWKNHKIQPTQISGVWVFARWTHSEQQTILGEMLSSLCSEHD